jgi:hypothetical protein
VESADKWEEGPFLGADEQGRVTLAGAERVSSWQATQEGRGAAAAAASSGRVLAGGEGEGLLLT